MSIFFSYFKLLILLIISVNAYTQNNPQFECKVGDTCIKPAKCNTVRRLLNESREQAINYLRQNHCGFEGMNPLVCCNLNVPTRPGGNQMNPGYPINDEMNPSSSSQSENNPQIDLINNNHLLPNNCGRDLSQRIVGGEKTDLDEFPWMVLLEYQKPNGRTTACGGVLISKRYVLTAAHCIKGKDLPPTWHLNSVRLGEYNTDTDVDCVQDDEDSLVCAEDPISIGIEEQIAHEEYRPSSRDQKYDIALLRLSSDAPFSNFISPICLPPNATIGNRLWVAGWGKTESRSASSTKLKLSIPLTDLNSCSQTYSNAGVRLGYGQICAGGQRGKDSCRGDSGGPLMTLGTTADGSIKWICVGIVSFGPSPCGMQGWPGIYTKVSDFVPWIVSKLRP